MTVEILPPLPQSGKEPERGSLRDGFVHGAPGGFKVVRVPPLLAGLLMIPLLLIALPILVVTSLFFGFRLWRHMAALSKMVAGGRDIQKR